MEKIRVACGNRGVGTAPLFAAVEGGYFKGQGLDPELLYYQGLPQALTALVAGQADFTNTVSPDVITIDLRTGADVVIVASAVSRSATYVCAQPGLRRREDLRGKRWGVLAHGDADHCAIVMAFERWGWDSWGGPRPDGALQFLSRNTTGILSEKWRSDMPVRIGDEAPDFTAETTEGKIRFHEWIGDKWVILFSHPKDFTPVCTTELGYMAGLKPEFDKRNTKIIGLSVDPVSDHKSWVKDIQETQGHAVNYPLIGDADLTVAKLYDMIHPNATGGRRTAADNATVRSVFVIGPDKKVKAMIVYPMSTGRNFDEVLRLLDSCQLTSRHTVATPVNWKPGQDVIIPTSVSDDDAKKRYPQGFKTLKPYLRTVAQPK
jgi:alkyl hydroperoxide reductase subunit AhpC